MCIRDRKTTIINLCRKLNEYYAEKGYCVRINPVGYDDRESRDDVFEKFTAHTADIVVFLVDKECKDDEQKRLEEELEYVCSSYKEYRRPEILVYMQDDVNESLKEAVRNKLIINGLGSSTIKNTEALESDVKENIEKYINSYNVLHRIQWNEKIRRWVTRASIIIFILFGILVGISIFLYQLGKEKRLLIAGGGSAKNLLEQEFLKGEKIDNTKNHPFWVYAPIPTHSAYRLLTEETVMDVEDFAKRNYYTIIMSADSAAQTEFLRDDDINNYRKTGVVIGIHIGLDSLVLYSNSTDTTKIRSIWESQIEKWDSIAEMRKERIRDSIDEYKIEIDSNTILTTNETSGTLGSYNRYLSRICGKKISLKPKKHNVFYSTNVIDTNIITWIALGSKYYCPKKEKIDIQSIMLSDAEPKQVYIYFMKYKEKNIDKYVIPKETKKFLEDIGIPDKTIEEIENSRVDDTTKILFNHFCVEKKCNIQCHKEFRNKVLNKK